MTQRRLELIERALATLKTEVKLAQDSTNQNSSSCALENIYEHIDAIEVIIQDYKDFSYEQ